MSSPDAPGRQRAATGPRFREILAVADPRQRGTAVATARRLAGAGIPLTVLTAATGTAAGDVHPDRIGAEVADLVAGRQGALLVIDAHGGGPAGGILFDADAEHILTESRRAVLVCGPRAEPATWPPVLVVPVDGRGAGTATLDAVERWAHTFTSSRTVIVSIGAASTWPEGRTDPVHDPARRAVADLARRGVDATLERLTTAEPAAALAEAAEAIKGAVLVAAAPRWPTTATHWFATVRRLIRQASRTVLVVPDDECSDRRAKRANE